MITLFWKDMPMIPTPLIGRLPVTTHEDEPAISISAFPAFPPATKNTLKKTGTRTNILLFFQAIIIFTTVLMYINAYFLFVTVYIMAASMAHPGIVQVWKIFNKSISIVS